MNHQKIMRTHAAYLNRSRWASITWLAGALLAILALQACTAVNTFPMTARAGDTVSVMVGGSEQARKGTMAVTMQDSLGQTWDLQALGLVRSVFNLRMDGRAVGQHYSSHLDSDISWISGHEPVQTVLVADIPSGVAPGAAKLTISLNVSDNSSGIADPLTVKLEIVPGSGSQDQFLRQAAGYEMGKAAQLSKLEPAPHAKITLGNATIGAASLKISFNNTTLNGDDINVYVPESTVRGAYLAPPGFGATQRMVYWHQDGQYLYIDVIAPQGIEGKYLQLYVIHPKNSNIQPNFTLTQVTAYGVDGSPISVQPTLVYFP